MENIHYISEGSSHAYHPIQSGPNSAFDYPLIDQKEARIGLRLKIAPNQPYFCNRTNYNVLIDTLYGPIPGPDGFLAGDGRKGCQNANMRRQRALYEAQFRLILAN